MARADIQLNSFLDRLDYNIDYERDDYATIYVSDTIERLLETPLEDIYDPVGSTAGADATYSLPPVELEDNTNDFEPVSLGEAAQILDGTTTVIPSFQSITDIGNIDLYNESYRIVRFFEGTLSFVVDNQFPVDVDVRIHLYDLNDQLVISSELFPVAQNTTETSSVQIDGLTFPQQLDVRLEIQSQGSTQTITVDDPTQLVHTQLQLLNASVNQLELGEAETFTYNFSEAIQIDERDDVLFTQLYLDKATFELRLVNEIQFPAQLEVSSNDVTVNDQRFQEQYAVFENNQTQVFTEDLDNTNLDFVINPETGKSEFLMDFELILNLLPGDKLDANHDVHYNVSFEIVEFEHAHGNFLAEEHMVADSFQFNQELSDLYDKVGVADPKLEFVAHNGFGVPFSLYYDVIVKRNSGDEFKFVTDIGPQAIEPAPELYTTAQTNWQQDISNSNIEEVISFVPDENVSIDAILDVNPNAVTDNLFHNESEFWIDVYAETPLHFNINNVEILDTIAIESSIDTTDLNNIIDASLHFDYVSDLPFEVQMNTQMIDTLSKKVYFELDPFILNPASISSVGELIEPSTGRISISLTDDEIDKLADVNGIPYELTVSTSDAETKDAKISANSTIELQVQVEVKIDLDE